MSDRELINELRQLAIAHETEAVRLMGGCDLMVVCMHNDTSRLMRKIIARLEAKSPQPT